MNDLDRQDDAQARALLANRRNGIGASEAAAACGLSRWMTPLELYLIKIGEREPQQANEAMHWGKRLENAILDELEYRTGLVIQERQPRMVECSRPYLWATLDGWIDEITIVEAKTASYAGEDWGEPGTDDIPTEYLIQISQQLFVSHARICLVPVLIAGRDFRIYQVNRSEPLIAHLLDLLAAFWHRVEQRQPPDPDWHAASTAALIESMYQPDSGKIIELGSEALPLIEDWQRSRTAASIMQEQLDQRKKVAQARLVEILGDAEIARLPDGRMITRKMITVDSHVVPEYSYARMTLKAAKKARIAQ
jgi:putative phage-type endonuclease